MSLTWNYSFHNFICSFKESSISQRSFATQILLWWSCQGGKTRSRSSHERCSVKKGVLRNFAKFRKTTFFTEHLWATASIGRGSFGSTCKARFKEETVAIKLGSHYAINDDIWRYLLGDNFLATVWTILSSDIAKISLNIVKYRSTQISKVFDKYRQISSRFMTYSTEFQMLSKDAACEIKLRWAKSV